MNKIITTTTNTLEGWAIDEYLPPISVNVVVGANILSDIAASWTDFFGGRSTTYEKKLQDIYQQAISNLGNKAKTIGANCILGLKIDIDEISGKGNQMFMITAIGTPVIASKINSTGDRPGQQNEKIIDGYYIENRLKAKKLIDKYKTQSSIATISQNEIDFMIECHTPQLNNFVVLICKYLCENDNYSENEDKLKLLADYFRVIDREESIELLYNELIKNDLPLLSRNYFITTINQLNLIQLDWISKLIDSDEWYVSYSALRLLSAGKDIYFQSEIDELEKIKEKIPKRFPQLGTLTTKKKLLSSSEKEVWICPCGCSNDINADYCTSCQKDINGFLTKQVKANEIVSLIGQRLEILNEQ